MTRRFEGTTKSAGIPRPAPHAGHHQRQPVSLARLEARHSLAQWCAIHGHGSAPPRHPEVRHQKPPLRWNAPAQLGTHTPRKAVPVLKPKGTGETGVGPAFCLHREAAGHSCTGWKSSRRLSAQPARGMVFCEAASGKADPSTLGPLEPGTRLARRIPDQTSESGLSAPARRSRRRVRPASQSTTRRRRRPGPQLMPPAAHLLQRGCCCAGPRFRPQGRFVSLRQGPSLSLDRFGGPLSSSSVACKKICPAMDVQRNSIF
jgi:hypothetical protein